MTEASDAFHASAKRDPPSVSYLSQSTRWPPPEFLHKRQARKQVKEFTKRGVEEMMGNYNIWYGKYESQEGSRAYARGKGEVADQRCVTATDVGRTRGTSNPGAYICYLFAQGRCHNGTDCSFLHTIPDDAFETRTDTAKDCFGRDRHMTDSDNMGGVGNMMKPSKTLYVGRLVTSAKESGDTLEARVREHFGEFGALDSCKAFPKRNIAFLQYKNRSGAEFAKIAMADQNVGGNSLEVINVRWATDDPNPKHIEMIKRKTQEQVKAALEAAGVGTSEEKFTYPTDYEVPAKRARLLADGSTDSAAAVELNESVSKDGNLAYPDTDTQFEGEAAEEVSEKTEAEKENDKMDDLFSTLKQDAEAEAGNDNWLRDAAWEAVNYNNQQEAAAPAGGGGGGRQLTEQEAQWKQYYTAQGYTPEQLLQWEQTLPQPQ